mmetsp:Transcript_59659/g.155131  ORF Transcript_59659/g.155131 Transcript_59659/m.155131 type:complete len:650 (-) Transcript_59659:59-2008(-)
MAQVDEGAADVVNGTAKSADDEPEAAEGAQGETGGSAEEPPASANGPLAAGGEAPAAEAAPAAKAEVVAPQGPSKAEVEAQLRAQRSQTMFAMIRQQNFSALKSMLEQNPEHWLDTDDEGHTLLHWASLFGNKDFVQLALSKDAKVNAMSHNKQTPLMWAVLRGHLPVSRALLDAKADIGHRDSLGATPCIIAIQHRNHRSLLLLMHRGGSELLAGVDNNGCTPVHWASYKGDLTALKLLDYFGADFIALDNARMLPLHRATCANEPSVIEYLVEKRCDPSQKNGEGKSCVDIADEQHSVQLQYIYKKLSKKGEGNTQQQLDLEGGGESSDSGSKKGEGMFKSMTRDKAGQKVFPAFWLVCVSLATFQYITELRAASYDVAPTASMLFELGVVMSLCFFFYVALTDPGKLPTGIKGRSGVEELMKALDGGVPEGQEPDLSRLCTTTWVLKDLRTKYCTQTGACVSEFDHYCVWLNTSIGRGNHRQFVGLALVEWFTQLTHIYLCWNMMRELVSYSSMGTWLFGVLTGYPLLTFIFLIQCLTAPWVLMLIVHQLRLVVSNLTTNEMMNMHRYEHFWVAVMESPGQLQKRFHNPFSKGGWFKNCMDFWWWRTRSEKASTNFGQCCSHDHGSHGHSHGHSHGGFGWGHGHSH